jgi:hypothetical protein
MRCTGLGFMRRRWGVAGGTGQHAWSSTGGRLSCRTDVLQTLLASRGAGLVVLVKAQKYIKEQC